MTPKRAFLCLLVLSFLSAAVLADGPEPDPWWKNVENTEALTLKWMAALTAIFSALATLVAFVIGKVNELKARVESQGHRVDNQQVQITSMALASPPIQSSVTASPGTVTTTFSAPVTQPIPSPLSGPGLQSANPKP